jgi:hypothetical protein
MMYAVFGGAVSRAAVATNISLLPSFAGGVLQQCNIDLFCVKP